MSTHPVTVSFVSSASHRSFRDAILAVLTTDDDTWPEPVIYAELIGGEYRFDASNKPALTGEEIIWLDVKPDSFGMLSDSPEADADFFASTLFEQALNQVHHALHSDT